MVLFISYNFIQKSKCIQIPNKENLDIKFNFFDPITSLVKLLDLHFQNSYFVQNASKVFAGDGERVYSTPQTCDWWVETQVSCASSR